MWVPVLPRSSSSWNCCRRKMVLCFLLAFFSFHQYVDTACRHVQASLAMTAAVMNLTKNRLKFTLELPTHPTHHSFRSFLSKPLILRKSLISQANLVLSSLSSHWNPYCTRTHAHLHIPCLASYPPFFTSPKNTGRGLVLVPADRGARASKFPGNFFSRHTQQHADAREAKPTIVADRHQSSFLFFTVMSRPPLGAEEFCSSPPRARWLVASLPHFPLAAERPVSDLHFGAFFPKSLRFFACPKYGVI